MKSEESYEGPDLEQNDEFELDWKARILYLFMKYFLATNRFVLILYHRSFSIPAAVHQIKS